MSRKSVHMRVHPLFKERCRELEKTRADMGIDKRKLDDSRTTLALVRAIDSDFTEIKRALVHADIPIEKRRRKNGK